MQYRSSLIVFVLVRIILGVFRRRNVHRVRIGPTNYHRSRVRHRATHVQLHQPENADHRRHPVLRVRIGRTDLRTFPFG